MNLKNVMQKMIVLPMTACVLFLGMQFSEASRVNPFSNVQTLDISGEAKVAYIDEKTTNFFNSSRPIAEEYVIPDGWQQEKLSFDGVSVENIHLQRQRQIALYFSCMVVDMLVD